MMSMSREPVRKEGASVLAGADFGAGIWDLLARGPRGEAHRAAIARAMGPVWEANHVWLIFLIVLLFTAYPPAFQVLCIAPVFPLVVARVAQHAGGDVIGIVNSARIGASFVGPVVATSILAWGSPATVYLVLAVLGAACVPVLRLRGPQSRAQARERQP